MGKLGLQGKTLRNEFKNLLEPTLIKSSNFSSNKIFVLYNQQPILYRGTGIDLSIYENNYQYTIASPEPQCYVIKSDGSKLSIGDTSQLVVAIQGRYNGRVLVTGSLDLLSNELYEKSNQSNRVFINNLVEWLLGLRGKIRVTRFQHSKVGETEKPANFYKHYDPIRFEIDIQEFSDNQWQDFITDDLQVEFTMLDPYYRLNLQQISGTSTYFTELTTPDHHGVYKFVFKYNKPGYNFIEIEDQAPVRLFRHDEHERFVLQAYPYYIGYWQTVLGFLVFMFYFMFGQNLSDKKKQQ